MHQVEILAILLAVVGAVGVVADQFRAPLPIMLIFSGVLISLVPYVPPMHLDPDVVFFIVLPPLLYMDSFQTPWKKLRDVGDLISMQAVGLVIATIFGVAAAIRLVVPQMPWAVALALGAIVSPTDAVAVSAMARGTHIPRRTMDVIKGESLVNDATGLVGFQYAVAAAVTGTFSLVNASETFLYLSIGGVAVGLVLGGVLSKIRTDLSHRPAEIIASLLSPFVVYLAAEHLNVSGILAVVTAGLFLGMRSPKMLSSPARVQAMANWETITYILNGLTFLLIGLQVRPIMEKVLTTPSMHLFLCSLVVIVSLFLIRFVWTFATVLLFKTFTRHGAPDFKHLFIFSWCGMRGVVSLAAALSLPFKLENGQPLPFRDLLIFITIVVIAFSLFVQGGTLPALLRRFGFSNEDDNSDEVERKIRLKLSREALRALDEEATRSGIDRTDPIFQEVINSYVLTATSNMKARDAEQTELAQKLEGIAIKSQRDLLIRLREHHDVDEAVFQSLQRELDLADIQRLPTERRS